MTTNSHQNINTEKDEISIKELIIKLNEWLKYLMSKWIIISIFGLFGGLLGFVYASTKQPTYTATTTFVLEDEKGSGLGSLAGLASMAGVDVAGGGGGIFKGENILELYKSRKMLIGALFTEVTINGKKQTLVEKYIDFNNLRNKWSGNPALTKLKFVNDDFVSGKSSLKTNRLRDSVLTEIVGDLVKNYLNVTKPDKQLGIIRIDVKGPDEFFAKTFNEEIVKNVNDYYLQTKTKKSLQNVKIMQGKTDSVRAVMNGAIYNAVAISDATPNLNPTRQIQRVAPTQRAQFSAEANKAILSSLMQNLEMAKVALMKETPLLEIIDQPVYPLKKDSFSRARGVVFGGILGCLIVSLILFFRRTFRLILA